MTSHPLIKYIELPRARITLPSGEGLEPILLENEYAVLLFENLRVKMRFYTDLKRTVDDTAEYGSHVPDSDVGTGPEPGQNLSCTGPCPSMVILECGQSAIERTVGFSRAVFVNCRSARQLLQTLREIPDGVNERIGSCRLNTLVIENLSAFYWSQKLLPRHEAVGFYQEINKLSHLLKSRYMCNVIVTMWDHRFDRGFNSRATEQHFPHKLADMTFVPADLFTGAPIVCAYRDVDVLQHEETGWKKRGEISL